jgi:hypothetical protein
MFPKRSFTSGFITKMLYAFLVSPMNATCSVCNIVDLTVLIIYSEVYKSLWSSVYCLPRLPVSWVQTISSPCSRLYQAPDIIATRSKIMSKMECKTLICGVREERVAEF